MLESRGVEFEYREYTKSPLDAAELRALFKKLQQTPADLLRKRDKAYGELGLTGDEDEATLIAHMADHPTLLQRPIAVLGRKAVVGRPVEAIEALL